MENNNDNLKKLEKDSESSWGGKREGSGRKPLLNKEELEKIKEIIAQHGSEEIEETGLQGEKIRQTRIEHLMNILYREGYDKKNISAIKEYLDRQMGRSKEHIDLTTKGKEFPTPLYAGKSTISISRQRSNEEDIPIEEEN